MKQTSLEKKQAEIRRRTIHTAALLFLEQGYTNTSMREIAGEADVEISAMVRVMGNKEGILCTLVNYVLERQFATAKKLLSGVTEDPVLFYAFETTLQLYMAESSEGMRNLYTAAYSMKESTELIYQAVARKLSQIFEEILPGLELVDFYELEIASGSIMRGYLSIPCDMHFTIKHKVQRFLETSLRVYKVPEEKIEEAIAFVSGFDFPVMARQIIEEMHARLEREEDEPEVSYDGSTTISF